MTVDLEFLIQKEGDFAWLPLESLTVEILVGRYQLIAQASEANCPVQVYIQHQYVQDGIWQEEVQQQLLRTDSQGRIEVLPPTFLQHGHWIISCSPAEYGQPANSQTKAHCIQLQVLDQEADLDRDWEFLDTPLSPVSNYQKLDLEASLLSPLQPADITSKTAWNNLTPETSLANTTSEDLTINAETSALADINPEDLAISAETAESEDIILDLDFEPRPLVTARNQAHVVLNLNPPDPSKEEGIESNTPSQDLSAAENVEMNPTSLAPSPEESVELDTNSLDLNPVDPVENSEINAFSLDLSATENVEMNPTSLAPSPEESGELDTNSLDLNPAENIEINASSLDHGLIDSFSPDLNPAENIEIDTFSLDHSQAENIKVDAFSPDLNSAERVELDTTPLNLNPVENIEIDDAFSPDHSSELDTNPLDLNSAENDISLPELPVLPKETPPIRLQISPGLILPPELYSPEREDNELATVPQLPVFPHVDNWQKLSYKELSIALGRLHWSKLDNYGETIELDFQSLALQERFLETLNGLAIQEEASGTSRASAPVPDHPNPTQETPANVPDLVPSYVTGES